MALFHHKTILSIVKNPQMSIYTLSNDQMCPNGSKAYLVIQAVDEHGISPLKLQKKMLKTGRRNFQGTKSPTFVVLTKTTVSYFSYNKH